MLGYWKNRSAKRRFSRITNDSLPKDADAKAELLVCETSTGSGKEAEEGTEAAAKGRVEIVAVARRRASTGSGQDERVLVAQADAGTSRTFIFEFPRGGAKSAHTGRQPSVYAARAAKPRTPVSKVPMQTSSELCRASPVAAVVFACDVETPATMTYARLGPVHVLGIVDGLVSVTQRAWGADTRTIERDER